MSDKDLRSLNDCMEAMAYYNGARKYRDNAVLTVIVEAYQMRSETLTNQRR